MNILGFDPGKDKCGVAIMSDHQELHYHQVIPSYQAISTLNQLIPMYNVSSIVIGNQTTSKTWKKQLETNLNPPISITLVDERYSTLEARDRYWKMYPPTGFSSLIPQSLRTIPRPIDDIVAILLIERYLNLKEQI